MNAQSCNDNLHFDVSCRIIYKLLQYYKLEVADTAVVRIWVALKQCISVHQATVFPESYLTIFTLNMKFCDRSWHIALFWYIIQINVDFASNGPYSVRWKLKL